MKTTNYLKRKAEALKNCDLNKGFKAGIAFAIFALGTTAMAQNGVNLSTDPFSDAVGYMSNAKKLALILIGLAYLVGGITMIYKLMTHDPQSKAYVIGFFAALAVGFILMKVAG